MAADEHPLNFVPPARKGRGTGLAIAHRFERDAREPFDDGWGSVPSLLEGEERPAPATMVSEERARSILTANDSPDIPFERSLNPYRGCEHGCIYCYARPTHGWLDLSPGLDFETKLVAKVNAAERLEAELGRPGYRPSAIAIGTVTDAYQPVERRLRLTRAVLELLARCRHPFTIVTKGSGVERDLDLIAPAAQAGRAAVFVSLTTLDAGLGRRLEPRAAAPLRRLQTVRRLAEAGVPVGISLAPLIPFLNEPEIERIVEAAAEAGAVSVHCTLLRLPWELKALFADWLAQHAPERAARVMARVREEQGGREYRAGFGRRMTGDGVWAALVRQRVRKAAQRCGLGGELPPLDCGAFVPPRDTAQGTLF